MLNAIAEDAGTRAVYLYPTKALAQDQARSLSALSPPNLRLAIYDGDTPQAERRQVRGWANLLLTNPDMLHTGILPAHGIWAEALHRLRYVVVDEAHVYRGVFGSHVANVLARLRRICEHYGSRPAFILASATIANPGQAGSTLAGGRSRDRGGRRTGRGARGRRLEPAAARRRVRHPGEHAGRGGDAARRAGRPRPADDRFVRSRKGCELVYRYAREGLTLNAPELRDRIAPYRAGYTPEQRRTIERGLADGTLLGVVATSALELGVDIGMLDCSISVGFPGAMSSLRQQWGRAGRRGSGLGLLVAGEDQLDQYLSRHPQELLDRPAEAAVSNPANPAVLAGHLRCAAAELPLTEGDAAHFGDAGLELARSLPDISAGPAGLVYRGTDHPAARIALRSASPNAVAVIEAGTGTLLGLVDEARADSTVHEGAIYLHLGQQYVVRALDTVSYVALVAPFDGDYYTQTRRLSATSIEEELEHRELAGTRISFGRIEVIEQVIGYQRKRLSDHEPIDMIALDMPERHFQTEAVWYVPAQPPHGAELLGSLHAAEHAMIGLLPLLATADRGDIGGLSTDLHPQTVRLRSSSTTGTPAVPASPTEGTSCSRAGSTGRPRCSRLPMRAPAVRRASNRPSAAT